MKPYAELLEFNQPNPVRKEGFTRIRDAFPGLSYETGGLFEGVAFGLPGEYHYSPERIVEFAGRWDYGEKNAKRLGETVKVRVTMPDPDNPKSEPTVVEVEKPIIQKYIDMGHESMLEMADATFFIECSRVVSHELVRHRIASFQQESQRFVKYDDESAEDLFYLPLEVDGVGVEVKGDVTFPLPSIQNTLDVYRALRKQGVAPQLARYVLPNAMRTRLIMKTNLREWRHICKLRLDKSAQPEMQELMQQIYDQLVDIFPNVMYNAIDGERGVR